MSSTIKDTCSLQVVKYSDHQNHFGNGWGLYVDIENLKPNLPKNHELIRKKYNIPNLSENLNERFDKFYYDAILHEEIDNETTNISNFILKIGSNAIIIMLITYTIIKIL